MEAMYQKAHAAIRADPSQKKPANKKVTKKIGYDAKEAKEEFLNLLEQMKE